MPGWYGVVRNPNAGPDVLLWQASQRQFLWEVVHDTRGVLRGQVAHAKLQTIRSIDSDARSDNASIDAAVALDAWTSLRNALDGLGARAPVFHFVGPHGPEPEAVVHYFEHEGREHSLVGGWGQPMLRGADQDADPLEVYPSGSMSLHVGPVRLAVRAVPMPELFEADLDGVVACLEAAAQRGDRIRFVER